ncbi:M56 family metallopeptidase [Mumia sp. zg.B53]|uniref:M56 family metallopeptidase n=1 Tax=unclassified Mumia TaxID=2621872 RepID=UPI001C6F2332|nr:MULTISPECIES: M56 family metallopeptidase [unclassified Mumia]MBW9216358.1 M56 family metallopeptidase [Mumia sp. zg.B53]MDD9348587.1 M56 family metallopeptidase [Mumia sp.]
MTTPLLLGLIGLALAQPVPAMLARMDWPYRAPRAAVVLWQALALAAILAVVGAGLSASLWLVVREGAPNPEPGVARMVLHVAFLGLTVVVVARTVWSFLSVAAEVRTTRRRHRAMVDLVGTRDDAGRSVRILDAHEPFAYCVPGLDARVVVSRGTLDSLDPAELDAVLAHERAHLRARHDVVVDTFSALHRAFPRVLRTEAALESTRVLVELLADDHARRRAGTTPLARALVKLGTRPAPAGALGASSTLVRRMDRLENEVSAAAPAGRVEALTCYVVAAVVVLVPTFSLAVPWIASAWSTLT